MHKLALISLITDRVMVNECIESLCKCGCEAVRATITAMERGLPVPQTEGLPPAEREQVLNELKSIMAVYDRRYSR